MKFETSRPVAFELSFRCDDARKVAESLMGAGPRHDIISAEPGYLLGDEGFGVVTVRVSATTEAGAHRRMEKALAKLGNWADKSDGEYGPDPVLIFVPTVVAGADR